MIQGTIPLVCLWLIVTGTWLSFGLLLATPWRETLLGRHLVLYIGILAVWWALVLIGSYIGVPKWLEVLQAVAFFLMPVAVWWRVFLQLRARHRPLTRKEVADGHR